MSSYPNWWNETITIFNRFEESNRAVTWYKTVITNCYWKNSNNQLTSGQVTYETDKLLCRIPKDKRYLDPESWDNLDAESRNSYFTVHTQDIVVLGEVDFELNEHEAGKRSSDLLNKYRKYDKCFVVEKFAINLGPLKCNEHYLLKGKGVN